MFLRKSSKVKKNNAKASVSGHSSPKSDKDKIITTSKAVPQYRKPLAIGRFVHGYYLLLRQTSNDGEHKLLSITSLDGEKFTDTPEEVTLRHKNRTREDLSKCRDFRLFSDDDEMVMTYMRRDAGGSSLVYAATKDRKTWIVAGEIKKINANGVLVPELKDGIGDAIYFGGDVLRIAVSKNTRNWNIIEPHRVPHWHFFDGANFRVVGALPIEKMNAQGSSVHNTLTNDAVAIFYESEIAVDILADVNLNNQKVGEERFIKMGAALFSQDVPTRLLWQTELPLIELPLDKIGNFSIIGVVPAQKNLAPEKKIDKSKVEAHRIIKEDKGRTIRIYGSTQQGEVSFIEFNEKVLADHRERRPVSLTKHPNNPIIEPIHHPEQKGHQWESDSAFNPAALLLDDKVHLLYRAVGNDGMSRIGYASSKDGVTIDQRSTKPIFKLDSKPWPMGDDEASYGMFHSGGSWGGSEDPKVTQIDDRVYLTYVAHNGYWPMRTALTSISVKDFLKKRWKWEKPVLMSPPNIGSKSVVILPERVNDQYVIFHRMWPNIMIDVVPDLEFGDKWIDASGKKRGGRWLTGQDRILPRRSYWDSQKMSMGSAPIKTDVGWLAIYNAVDRRDSSKYKIGAMLLDLKDPRKVLARSRRPILSPEEWYENDGKPGVAYPGGAVNIDGKLHVYYGGGDKVGCVATIPTDNLVWHLLRDAEPHFNITPCLL